MTSLARFIRLVVGVAMVAGGVGLVAPFALRLSAVVAERHGGEMLVSQAMPNPPEPQAVPPVAPPSPAGDSPGTEPQLAQPDPPAAMAGPQAGPPFPDWNMAAASGPPVDPSLPPRADYQPPPPPAPLPPQPAEFVQPQPGLPGIYRSALEVPPPPLLDAQRPPPLAAAWPAQTAARPSTGPAPAGSLPATYRVRDGDDLAGIAARMYGHPAAATALWAANRDLISDPGLLPIGAELRLPPPWEIDVAGGSAGGSAVIEPRRGPVFTPAAAGVGGRIRVAPGDTLPAIAGRLYGDPAVARRIWELNRDQLRSPELVVPGMELRLPPLPQ